MKNHRQYFITGISTEVGKTVASAIIVKALEADYWKPVQSGDLHHTDSDKIAEWAAHPQLKIHPETHRLNTPASPHYSAQVDQVSIQLSDFQLPKTDNHLIVEGAGGLLVPLNQEHTILDLMVQLQLPVIVVANYYLGSINHTLSTLRILRDSGLDIHALIFMGNPIASTRDIIIEMSKDDVRHFVEVPLLSQVDAKHVQEATNQLKAIV